MRNYLLIIILLFLTTNVFGQPTGLFKITDIFEVTGRGTMFVGSLEGGSLRVGDEVDLVKPDDTVAAEVTIAGIEQFRVSLQIADQIGEQYGILVNATDADQAEKGYRLMKQGNITNQNFVFAGENSYSITGKGTTLAGTIRSGRIAVGDQLDVISMDYDRKSTTITAILRNQQEVSSAGAGEFVGLVLRSIDRQEVDRGTVLATPGTVEQTNVIGANFTFQKDFSIPDETIYLYGSYLLNVDTPVRILLAGSPQLISSGTHRSLYFSPDKPVIVRLGERIYLRKSGQTVAEGTVTEIGLP